MNSDITRQFGLFGNGKDKSVNLLNLSLRREKVWVLNLCSCDECLLCLHTGILQSECPLKLSRIKFVQNVVNPCYYVEKKITDWTGPNRLK